MNKVKKYVVECKKCNLQGVGPGDLFGDDRDIDRLHSHEFQGISDLFGDDLPAEPWLEGDNDLFAGALYPDDDNNDDDL